MGVDRLHGSAGCQGGSFLKGELRGYAAPEKRCLAALHLKKICVSKNGCNTSFSPKFPGGGEK